MEKKESSYTTSGNVNWNIRYEEHYGGSLKHKIYSRTQRCHSWHIHEENHNSKRYLHPNIFMYAKLLHPCQTLFNPMDCSLPGSSVHGILQARILEWVAISFYRGSSRPRDGTCIPYLFYLLHWQGFLYH